MTPSHVDLGRDFKKRLKNFLSLYLTDTNFSPGCLGKWRKFAFYGDLCEKCFFLPLAIPKNNLIPPLKLKM